MLANPKEHLADTCRTLRRTTSIENIELITNVTHHIVIDGTWKESKERFNSTLNDLNKFGIDEDSLYEDIIQQGVDRNEINNGNYNSTLDYLQKWLLSPAIGNGKHQYTHKGWNYPYINDKDGSDFSAKEKQQSWNVRKKLLINVIEKIYSLSFVEANNMAATLYNVHRLRDLQYNGTKDKKPGEYLKNVPFDLEEYTLPIIKEADIRQEFIRHITLLKKNIDDYYDCYFENGYNESINISPLSGQIDCIIGSIDDDNDTMIGNIFWSA